ncbi:Protein DEK, partial [Trachymyrmex zeteki]
IEKLEQIKTIANNLKTNSKKAVQAQHRFVFEREGDRDNRKRLREFRGFPFAIDSEDYKAKIAYVESNLTWADLVSVCNILTIEYSGIKRELSQRLCNGLVDLDSLNNPDESDKEENAEDSDIQQQESSESEEDRKDVKRRIKKTKYEEVAVEEDEEDENENEEDEVKEDQNEDENDRRSVSKQTPE